nr:uncharacterized protein LOC108054649 [Drosophila takahashii]
MGSTSEYLRKIGNNEYELHLNIKFPFKLTPIRDDERKGFVMLKAEENEEHPAIRDGFLNRAALKGWIRNMLKPKYVLHNSLNSYDDLNIKFHRVSNANASICLHIWPMVEFDYSKWPLPVPELPESTLKALPWYAVPQMTTPIDRRSFMAWSPDWERCILEMNPQSQKVRILMMDVMSCMDIPYPEDVIQTLLE